MGEYDNDYEAELKGRLDKADSDYQRMRKEINRLQTVLRSNRREIKQAMSLIEQGLGAWLFDEDVPADFTHIVKPIRKAYEILNEF